MPSPKKPFFLSFFCVCFCSAFVDLYFRERCEGFFRRNLLHTTSASISFWLVHSYIHWYVCYRYAISYICSLHAWFSTITALVVCYKYICMHGLLDLLLGVYTLFVGDR